MTKGKKIGIGIGITVGGIILSVFAFMPTQNFGDELILSVFDLNFCPNQNTIIGELWFLLDETTTVPVSATVNYEINDLEDLIEEGKIRISPKDFKNWDLFGREIYAYDFEIPVKSNVEGNDVIITVMVDGGNNLVYEDKIKHIDSLDNCKFY